jgi:hypothetical protein
VPATPASWCSRATVVSPTKAAARHAPFLSREVPARCDGCVSAYSATINGAGCPPCDNSSSWGSADLTKSRVSNRATYCSGSDLDNRPQLCRKNCLIAPEGWLPEALKKQ